MATEYQKQGISLNEYAKIHKWLRENTTKDTFCHHCGSESDRLQNALINGRRYDYKEENYITLCSPCHRAYDAEYARKTKDVIAISVVSKKKVNKAYKMLSDYMKKNKKKVDIPDMCEAMNLSETTIKKYLNGGSGRFIILRLMVERFNASKQEKELKKAS